MHAWSSLWCCGSQYNSFHEVGPNQCDLLGDEPAQGVAQYVDMLELKCGDETDRIMSHLGHRERYIAGAGAHTCIVEGYDSTIAGQCIQ